MRQDLGLAPAEARTAILEEYGHFVRALHLGGGGRSVPWAEIDLTLPQLKLLGLLACRTDGMHGRELARVLGVGPSAVTALVERIVEAGYVRREEDHHDRRITRVQLTERGRALVERMTAGQRERLGEVLEQLDQDELQTVLIATRILAAAAGRLVPVAEQSTLA